MHLENHLQSYRDSLQATALEGCVEYSKTNPTLIPAQYPTIHDWLKFLMHNATLASRSGMENEYAEFLHSHQASMLAMLKKMAKAAYDATPGEGEEKLLTFVATKGWMWFRYIDKELLIKTHFDGGFDPWIGVVPRYTEDVVSNWITEGAAVLDATEMALLQTRGPGAVCESFLRTKVEHPYERLLSIEKSLFQDVRTLNSGLVGDWALHLFGGNHAN